MLLHGNQRNIELYSEMTDETDKQTPWQRLQAERGQAEPETVRLEDVARERAGDTGSVGGAPKEMTGADPDELLSCAEALEHLAARLREIVDAV